MLLETYVTRPRHIEVQVFADSHGNVVHLFERDCSLQRRHQKVIEEAPAPGMDAATREAVCGAAVRAAKAVDYRGAGTIEFIADASDGLRADRIYFMEMNTRLQVEHPVTEMITGQDLVEWQLRVASGEPLPKRQDELKIDGWAMEARLYAENPATGFLPSTGRLEHFDLAFERRGVRVDAGVEEGGEVSPFYDPMVAKIIVHDADRTSAARRLAAAVEETEVWPVRTNAGFLAKAAHHPAFVAGEVDTGFIASNLESLLPAKTPSQSAVNELVSRARRTDTDLEDALNAFGLIGFRLNAPPRLETPVWVEGEQRSARFSGRDVQSSRIAEEPFVIYESGSAYGLSFFPPLAGSAAGATSDGQLLAPMPGKVVQLAVKAGERVAKGAPVVTLEAMKMEHGMTAPFDAVVAEAPVSVGQQVAEGTLLVRLEAAEG